MVSGIFRNYESTKLNVKYLHSQYIQINQQTQFHEKNCRFIVSKFVKLSDELIISLYVLFVTLLMDPPDWFIDGQELGRSKVPSDLNKVSRASKNMWKILVLAPVLFLLSNSEVISKRKTIPISKETCPCWWDLEGTQIDPNTNQPYKCACCKSGKKICNFLCLVLLQVPKWFTEFPCIVSAETILFWR